MLYRFRLKSVYQTYQDPACYMENKVQRTSRKIKSTMPQNLLGSYPAKFYVAAKMHKFSTNNDES